MKRPFLFLVVFSLIVLWFFPLDIAAQRPIASDRLEEVMDSYYTRQVQLDWRKGFSDEPVNLGKRELLLVRARMQPASGYRWMVASYDSTLLKHEGLSDCLAVEPGYPGQLVDQRLIFQAKAEGLARIELVYQRPWQGQDDALSRRVIEVKAEGSYRGETFVEPLCPQPEPSMKQSTYKSDNLPAHFDWREHGGVTPVRDQGSCGSCWAFGTAAMFESAILINDGIERDLSEQFLVSCVTEFNGCEGGWWALPYFVDEAPVGDSGPGAVYEHHFPYEQEDLDCQTPYMHYEKAAAWGYVDGVEDDNRPTVSHMPSVEEIKKAILKYGPVGTDVCSDTWSSYTGGVHTAGCANKNHIVLITGWDDDQQCWYIKNSWGTDWGEEGYMRLGYGKCEVGSYSTWIDYRPENTRLVYQQVEFWEGFENNGTFDDTVQVDLLDGGLALSNKPLEIDRHFAVQNLPEGLEMQVFARNDTALSVWIDGQTPLHTSQQNRRDVELIFLDSAFAHSTREEIVNDTFSLMLHFSDPYDIEYHPAEDIHCHARNYWVPFDLDKGNGSYVAWYDEGNLRLETFGKACVAKGASRNISPLPIGTVIGENSNWVKGGRTPMQHFISHSYYHDWNGQEAFIGIRFHERGHPHYGWLRVVVDSSGSEFVIRDYAFNQQPYASIRAGQLSDETLVPEADFIASEDTIYVDEEITFSDQSLHHPLLYNWTFEGGVPPHSREKEQTVTYPQPGSFDVSLKVLNSQGVDSLIRQNTITVLEQPATSLNAPRDKSAFRIYPNPSNGSWSLFVPAGLHQQALTVRVYDVHGRPVMEESTSAGAPDTRFRMSHCPPGIYYVAVYNGNRILFRTALTIQ